MLDVLLGSGLSAPLLPSHLLVSAPRVLLHASGDLSLQGGRLSPPPATVALARPADHLMTAEDWRQLALHSAVVTVAACVAGGGERRVSRDLVQLMRSNLAVDQLEQLPDPTLTASILASRAGQQSSSLVTSLCSRMDNSSTISASSTSTICNTSRLLSSTNSGIVSRRSAGWRRGGDGGSVSCPSLLPSTHLHQTSSSSSVEQRVNSYLRSRRTEARQQPKVHTESRNQQQASSSSLPVSRKPSSPSDSILPSETSNSIHQSLETRLNPSLKELEPLSLRHCPPDLEPPRLHPCLLELEPPSVDDCLQSLINNNDVFNLLNLPGLKLKPKRPPPPPPSTNSDPLPPAYVPGFIRRRQRAAVCVNLSGSGVAGCVVRVVLLTGHRLEVRVDKVTKVDQVLSLCLDRIKVTRNSNSSSSSLFALFSCLDGELLYLKGEAAVSSYLQHGVLTLYLRFLGCPDYHDLPPPLQHLLYLQLRQDVISGQAVSGLEDSTSLQLALLAAQVDTTQASCPAARPVRLEPGHFLPRYASPAVGQRLLQQLEAGGWWLTGSPADAQALFCGLVVNSGNYALYRYWGQENRAEASRRVSLRLGEDRVVVGGVTHPYTLLKQVSHSQSYLQLLVKQADQVRRVKIFLPDNKPRQVHDLITELQLRHVTASQSADKAESGGGLGSRTRRSLGQVCKEIVGVAKEVGRTMRTPSKRTRSLSTGSRGGKRRRLSLGRPDHSSTRHQDNQDNQVHDQDLDKENLAPASTSSATTFTSSSISTTSSANSAKTPATRTPGRPRMGTRMSAGSKAQAPGSTGLGCTTRVLQLQLQLDQLQVWDFRVAGHGLEVSCRRRQGDGDRLGTEEALRPRDRLIAVNGLGLDQVSLNTFNKILPTLGDNLDVIIARPIKD